MKANMTRDNKIENQNDTALGHIQTTIEQLLAYLVGINCFNQESLKQDGIVQITQLQDAQPLSDQNHSLPLLFCHYSPGKLSLVGSCGQWNNTYRTSEDFFSEMEEGVSLPFVIHKDESLIKDTGIFFVSSKGRKSPTQYRHMILLYRKSMSISR